MGKRKGGWQTRTTPRRSMVPEKHLTLLSLSPSIAADKTIVTTGQVKMMQRASGTGRKLTLARLVMKEMDPITPDNKYV